MVRLLAQLFVLFIVAIFIITLGSFAILLSLGIIGFVAILVIIAKFKNKRRSKEKIIIYPPDKHTKN